MKLKIIFLFFLFASTKQLTAQKGYYFYDGSFYNNPVVFEIGGSVGVMNALTDLGGRKGLGKKFIKDYNFKNNKVSGSIFFSAVWNNSIGLRLEASFGTIHAYDSILKNVAPTTNERYERNLSFQSSISELSVIAEVHPFYLFGNYDDDRYPPAVSPYLMVGVGYYHFNPQAILNGNIIDLHPLKTEGQGFPEYPNVKEYKLNQVCFPVGIGGRYDLSPLLNVRFEIATRILQTDYLDDVSGTYIDPSVFSNHLSGIDLQRALLLNDRHKPGASTAHPDGIRGRPTNNDAYVTFLLKLGLTLGRERRN